MLAISELIREILFFVAYVNSGTSFPEPLSKEAEASYIAMHENGDEAARAVLIEHNLRLVAHIAKKYTRRQCDTDDIISIGTIGLIKAVSSYKSCKGALVPYASRCIENEILMHLRSERKRTKHEVYLDDPIGHDSDGNDVTLGDKLGSDPAHVEHEASRHIFKDSVRNAALSVLDERERTVIGLRYSLDGKSSLPQREVARLMNISRSYVSRIEKRALCKLSAHFDGTIGL